MKSAKILLSAAQRIGVAIAVASIVAGSPAVAQSTKLDDATVFAIFDQANMVDITTGRLGAKMGHSEDVRAHGRA
ncbi:MAG: hypothetical protein HY057_08150, partial [Rhodospirillales bacterium]|nr:hypothetical protein [Rhodospirillales bacterium]